MSPTKKGYAVQFTRPDGTVSLSRETGELPVVYGLRKWADWRRHKLSSYGFKCRIVEVRYADPVVVEK